MLDIILVLGLIGSNFGWWIYVRHLSGVVSDLKDVSSDLKNATAKVSSAGNQVAAAVQSIKQ